MDNKAKDTNNKGGVSPSSRPKINFGNSVLVMPRAAAERFASATKKDIMALIDNCYLNGSRTNINT